MCTYTHIYTYIHIHIHIIIIRAPTAPPSKYPMRRAMLSMNRRAEGLHGSLRGAEAGHRSK